jgi:hypothetical protein
MSLAALSLLYKEMSWLPQTTLRMGRFTAHTSDLSDTEMERDSDDIPSPSPSPLRRPHSSEQPQSGGNESDNSSTSAPSSPLRKDELTASPLKKISNTKRAS